MKRPAIVVMLGADGAGKTTLIRAVVEGLTQTGRRVALFHFRPVAKPGQPVSNPYTKHPHPLLVGVVKMVWWLAQYNAWALWTALRRDVPDVVLFDRSILDVMFDPQRYRLSEGFRGLDVMPFLLLKPSVVFLLNAPAAELQRRKTEVTWDEAARQSVAYGQIPKWKTKLVALDGCQPPDVLARQVLQTLTSL
jgi:thymidylate kinase